jgi:hypothetical protein
MIPVFASKTDGTSLTAEEAVALSEYCNQFTPSHSPFTKLLKECRIKGRHGLRAFAETIGMLPSRFAAIQNGREQPTDDELQAIVKGLFAASPPAAEPSGPEQCKPSDGWRAIQFGVHDPDWLLFHDGAMYSQEKANEAALWLARRSEVVEELGRLRAEAQFSQLALYRRSHEAWEAVVKYGIETWRCDRTWSAFIAGGTHAGCDSGEKSNPRDAVLALAAELAKQEGK